MKSKSDSEKGFSLNKRKIIRFKNIIYCQAEGCFTRIYLENKSFLISKILKEVELQLPADQFFRIHKSLLININFIIAFDVKSVTLNNNLTLPVSRGKMKDLIEVLSNNNLII
jgi:two-component system, LytTR family, response regulator